MPTANHLSSAPIAFVALIGMVLTSAATWITRSAEEQRDAAAREEAVQEATFLLRNELDQLLRRFERIREALMDESPLGRRDEFVKLASGMRFEAPFVRWTGWQLTPVQRPTTQMAPTTEGGAVPMMALQPARQPAFTVEPGTLSGEFGTIEPSLKSAPTIEPRAMPFNSHGISLILLRAALGRPGSEENPSVLTMGLSPDLLLVMARNMRIPRPLDLWLSTLDAPDGSVTSAWYTALDFEREDNPTWTSREFSWCGLNLRLESIQPGFPTHGMSFQAMTVLSFGLVGTMVATLLFTARRRSRDLERQVKARTRELQLSMEELRSYGEMVARELREPLERIDDFCRALSTEWAGSATRAALLHVETIGTNSREMAERIAMLRRMPELLTRGLELRVLDLDTMVRPLLAPHVEEQAARNVRIELGQLGKVLADPLLISEVFRILLANAIEATRGKDAPQVVIERLADPKRAVLAIHDNGSGLGPSEQRRVFDQQLAPPRKGGTEERGMGLALCKRILERHGGSIQATGEPGKGTSFVFWLPLDTSTAD